MPETESIVDTDEVMTEAPLLASPGPEDNSANGEYPNPVIPQDPHKPDDPSDGGEIHEDFISLEGPDEQKKLVNDCNNAYACIEITGELPEMLVPYVPVSAAGWQNWDVYYVIPRDVAQGLITKIENREGVVITYNHEDGDFAMVLYKSR